MPAVVCDHASLEAEFHFGRIRKSSTGQPVGTVATMRIRCSKCGMPFRFLGLDTKMTPEAPSVTAWGDQIRAPIQAAPELPRWEKPIAARAVVTKLQPSPGPMRKARL